MRWKKKVSRKRSQVATILEGQLDQATRSGNLDSALAIKAHIERLKALGEELQKPQSEQAPAEIEMQTDQLSNIDSERDFRKWLESVEFRNGSHISWIDGNRIYDNRGANTQSTWGTELECDVKDKLVTFTWTGASKARFTIKVISNSEAEGILAGGNKAKLEVFPRSSER